VVLYHRKTRTVEVAMMIDESPEITPAKLSGDERTESELALNREIGAGIADNNSTDAKTEAKDEKILKLKKHPGAPKRFRT
jgi:hypothetical protein